MNIHDTSQVCYLCHALFTWKCQSKTTETNEYENERTISSYRKN